MEESPLYVFRSPAGRLFLSAILPPENFAREGIQRADSFDMIADGRPIPCTNWATDDPAVLFCRPGTRDYLVGFPGDSTPDGYERLGSNFAFILDEWNLKRAMELDAPTA